MVKKSSAKKAQPKKTSVKKAPQKSFPWAEVIIVGLIVAICGFSLFVLVNNAQKTDYVVETNAFFAPFEFYDNNKIVGVDVEIIDRVAEKLNKTIAIKDVEFDVIIDNVEAGRIADAGAAGLTITDARKAKVDFSTPYYTSVQYAIFDKNSGLAGKSYVTWNDLSGAILGSQTGSTGYLFTQGEIKDGVLMDTGTMIKGFETHQLAADAIGSQMIDFAIADELVAKMIVAKNANLVALPLYYMGENGAADYPVEESYAIAVNKNQPELLNAFNEVLAEMLVEDANGESEIDRLVLKYTGF